MLAREEIANACALALEKVSGLDTVEVNVTASGFGSSVMYSGKEQAAQGGVGLHNVSWAIAVSSAKGGVGKSTVAMQLARALIKQGARVGLADVDVEGPSLPTLIGIDESTDLKHLLKPAPAGGNLIAPLERDGLRLASSGFVQAPDGLAAALRGPLAARVATQVLAATDWGRLDYLLLDFPPGIGDVPISLARDFSIHANVLVTTPSKLAVADVKRGAPLLETFKVPTIATVTNMAYFKCSNCDQKHRLFGPDSLETTLPFGDDQLTLELPFSLAVRDTNEMLRSQDEKNDPESEAAYNSLAKHLVSRLLLNAVKTKNIHLDAYLNSTSDAIILRSIDSDGAHQFQIPLSDLRTSSQKQSATPTRVGVIAKRALSLDWSDGRRNDLHDLNDLFRRFR